MHTEICELDISELNAVTGGMKWTPVENKDVIDARGGQIDILGIKITLDVKGNVSSIGL